MGSVWPPEVGAGCPYKPHSHLTLTQPHTLPLNHVHTHMASTALTVGGSQVSLLLHTHSPHTHTDYTHLSHQGIQRVSFPVAGSPPSPSCPHFRAEGAPNGRQLRTREKGGQRRAAAPPCVSSLAAIPLIRASQSSWGSPAPSAPRSPRDNGIISGGRGCLGQGLRRRCLLSSIRPSAPNQRLRRLGRVTERTRVARVAGRGRPNSISWVAAPSPQLWAGWGSALGSCSLCLEPMHMDTVPPPLTPPPFWHLRLRTPPALREGDLGLPRKVGKQLAAGGPKVAVSSGA